MTQIILKICLLPLHRLTIRWSQSMTEHLQKSGFRPPPKHLNLISNVTTLKSMNWNGFHILLATDDWDATCWNPSPLISAARPFLLTLYFNLRFLSGRVRMSQLTCTYLWKEFNLPQRSLPSRSDSTIPMSLIRVVFDSTLPGGAMFRFSWARFNSLWSVPFGRVFVISLHQEMLKMRRQVEWTKNGRTEVAKENWPTLKTKRPKDTKTIILFWPGVRDSCILFGVIWIQMGMLMSSNCDMGCYDK